MGIVQNEFFVQYLTSSISMGKFYVVMEIVDGIEFKDAVLARQAAGAAIPDAVVAAWAQQLSAGLAYLHDVCHLVHQDLHNGNVMLAGLMKNGPVDDAALSRARVKILDLGLSSFKSDQAQGGGTATRTMHMGAVMQTMRMGAIAQRRGSVVSVDAGDIGGFKAIRAPEMWPSSPTQSTVRFNSKTDVWALGILLSEAILLSSIEQWYLLPNGETDRAQMQSFGQNPALQAAKVAEVQARSAVLGNIVPRMLESNPRVRLSATQLHDELRQHTF